MQVNKDWHGRHKLPENATLDQRIEWHMAHARNCACSTGHGEILEALERRYMNTHQAFWIHFNKGDHLRLSLWAAACAEHVLPLFEEKYPEDPRPREALRTLRQWATTGEFSMAAIRGAALAAHAAAREVKQEDSAACFAARAAGQAVATAHVPTHALGAALYAFKAVAAANPTGAKAAIAKERGWQREQLPDDLQDWVEAELAQKGRAVLPKSLRG